MAAEGTQAATADGVVGRRLLNTDITEAAEVGVAEVEVALEVPVEADTVAAAAPEAATHTVVATQMGVAAATNVGVARVVAA